MTITVNVAKDFSKYPAGRYRKNGSTSGEAFRDRFLLPALLRGEQIVVELDGTIGYGSSFLEEAFGGAVRAGKLPAETVLELIDIRTRDLSLKELVQRYIRDAAATREDGG